MNLDYLDNQRVRIGDLVLRGHVLLHGLAGAPDGQQDERVGQEDDRAGDNVAAKEEADDVAHGRRALAGSVPVDAASCTIWLGPVLAPAGQGTDGKDSGVAPDSSDQQAGVAVGELVT